MSSIKLRPAEATDSEDLFTWANNPLTRRMSFSSDPITHEQHQDWFRRSMEDRNRLIFMAANEQGDSVGMVRIDRLNTDVAELAINTAPALRGRGYGADMIAAVCTRNDLGAQLFLARIKNGNVASIRAFKKAGFLEVITHDDLEKGRIVIMVKIAQNAGR